MNQVSDNPRFDPRLYELIPHREPMLLVNRLLEVNDVSAEAMVLIDEQTPFFEKDKGVPTWIGLEYMGQTSALIAGYQLQKGAVEPHLGFLMGSRKYQTSSSYFQADKALRVHCQEAVLVGDSLATFNCIISDYDSGDEIASAMLSVFRRPLNQGV